MLVTRAGAARAIGLVVLVGTLLVLPRLGHREIVGTHEAVFPLVARDMMARHAWLGAELRGRPYRNKPPLHPWAIAAFSSRAGTVTEVTARLPGALSVIGAAAATCALGIQLFGRRAGLWSGLILLTSIAFFDHALVTIPDLPMLFFDLLAGVALWSVAGDGGWRAGLALYVALALAVGTKGIPGLLPLAVGLIWIPIDGGARRLRRLVSLPGLAVFTVLTVSWLVPYMMRTERFGAQVVAHDWFSDVLGMLSPATLLRQIVVLALALLPWTAVLPLAIVAAVRARRDRAVAFALCWFAIPAILTFAVQQQRGRYLLPLLPGAALLVAWWADREAATSRRRALLAALAMLAAVAAPIAAPIVLRNLDLGAVARPPEIAIVVASVSLVAVVAAITLWAGRMAITVPVVAATSAVALFVGGWIVDGWENRAWDYRRVAADLGKITRPLGVVALTDDQDALQLDFYLGHSLPALRSPEALSEHLAKGGAAVVDTLRWRSAAEWLPVDVPPLRVEPVGADVLLLTARTP